MPNLFSFSSPLRSILNTFHVGALYEMTGIEPLPSDDSMEDSDSRVYHKATKLRFSEKPLRVMLTWAKEDYERRGEGIDPLAATAQYELEKRIGKMDQFEIFQCE